LIREDHHKKLVCMELTEDMASFVEELKAAAKMAPAAEESVQGGSFVSSQSVDAPTAQVAHVIGLRGEHLAMLNERSGATIRVIHGGRGRKATSRFDIEGPKDAVEAAAAMVEARLAEVRSPRRVRCDRTVIGKVIGRNGERVKEIQEVSGATIQVDQRYDPCVVEISGPPTPLLKAAELVLASVEGRYASSITRISDLHRNDPVIDPYREIQDTSPSGGAAARVWFPARDDHGRVYWYHAHTGQTQWENPYGGGSSLHR